MGRPRLAKAEEIERANEHIQAVIRDVQAGLKEYLSKDHALEHELAIARAHIRYLKKAKPDNYRAAIFVLETWAQTLQRLKRKSPIRRQAELLAMMEDKSGTEPLKIKSGVGLTPKDLELVAGVQLWRLVGSKSWILLGALWAQAADEKLAVETEGSWEPVGEEQIENFTKQIEHFLLRALRQSKQRTAPAREALLAYEEKVAARRRGEKLTDRQLAAKYPPDEFARHPETATRKMNRWLHQAREHRELQ